MSISLIPPRRSKMSSELSSDACPGADHAARCACRPGRYTRHVACHAFAWPVRWQAKVRCSAAPRRVGYTCKSRRRSVAGSVVTEGSDVAFASFQRSCLRCYSLSRHLPGPFRHPNAPRTCCRSIPRSRRHEAASDTVLAHKAARPRVPNASTSASRLWSGIVLRTCSPPSARSAIAAPYSPKARNGLWALCS